MLFLFDRGKKHFKNKYALFAYEIIFRRLIEMFIDNLRELLVLWLLQRCFVGFTARHSANNTHSLKIQCDIYMHI